MTIRQLPDFAFRSASATTRPRWPTSTPATTRLLRGRASSTCWSGCSVFHDLPLDRGSAPASRPRHLDRRLHPRSDAAAVARSRATSGSSSPSRSSTRRCPTGRRWTRCPTRRPSGPSLRRHGFRVREADRDDGIRLPLRRPPPVDEARDAVHPPRADPVPRRGRRDVAARRRAGPGRRRGRVADRPADRDARPAARQELGFEAPGSRDRPGQRLHDRPRASTRTARRSPARRSGSTTRCRSPATRSTRTGSGPRRTSSIRDAAGPAAVGRPGAADRRGRRLAVRDDRRSRAATSACSCSCAADADGTRRARRPAVPRRRDGRRRLADRRATSSPLALAARRDRRAARTWTSRSGCRTFSDYTLLIAKKDPGQGIVWTAFASLIAGIAITFYLPRRRIWARLAPDGRAGDRRPVGSLRRRRARVRAAARRPRRRAAAGLTTEVGAGAEIVHSAATLRVAPRR